MLLLQAGPYKGDHETDLFLPMRRLIMIVNIQALIFNTSFGSHAQYKHSCSGPDITGIGLANNS